MKFTIFPEKKKRIKAISQASNELCYKVFLADDNNAVLVAAFAFEHDANTYIMHQKEYISAEYTVVYVPAIAPAPSEALAETSQDVVIDCQGGDAKRTTFTGNLFRSL